MNNIEASANAAVQEGSKKIVKNAAKEVKNTVKEKWKRFLKTKHFYFEAAEASSHLAASILAGMSGGTGGTGVSFFISVESIMVFALCVDLILRGFDLIPEFPTKFRNARFYMLTNGASAILVLAACISLYIKIEGISLILAAILGTLNTVARCSATAFFFYNRKGENEEEEMVYGSIII